MKNLITLLAILTLTTSVAFANNTPEVNVTIDNLEIFSSANFDSNTKSLDFTTISDMTSIQIFSLDGNLMFNLPVMSDHVAINKNLFETGSYKLGFVMDGNSQVHYTHVTIKK